jgi:hypothetical protein
MRPSVPEITRRYFLWLWCGFLVVVVAWESFLMTLVYLRSAAPPARLRDGHDRQGG